MEGKGGICILLGASRFGTGQNWGGFLFVIFSVCVCERRGRGLVS